MTDETAETPATGDEPTEAVETPPREPRSLHVPRWLVAALAALVLLGAGFGIGWAAAPGGGHERGIGSVRPAFPGGSGGPGGRFVAPGGGGGFNFGGQTRIGGAFLGVQVQDASGGQQGASISNVQSGSPADQAGLKAGDVVTAVDSNPVTSASQLAQRISGFQAGDQITITYTRSGASAQATVKLGSRAAPQPSNPA
jgi:membrane-associated protease RseP (regulator of RpoE activity)